MALLPYEGKIMDLKDLNKITVAMDNTPVMPVLFLGHGSPMNAIEDNEFVHGFRELGKTIPRPTAILCISAHWETKGTFVTAMNNPPTIHDFGGFPKELFEVQYHAPGSPQLARETQNLVRKSMVCLDENWGLDHGTWSVLKHLYPAADVPVVQMSLDYFKSPQDHYELAKELEVLRYKGILIVGSGNIVHNLRYIAWDKLNAENYGYDWALEANEKIKNLIMEGNHKQLINYKTLGKVINLAIPTPEHYLPLLYILALKKNKEEISIFNDKEVAGSLSMTSLKVS